MAKTFLVPIEAEVEYDNTISGLSATKVKEAIDEVVDSLPSGTIDKSTYAEFTATGAIAEGEVVSLLPDGTVEAIGTESLPTGPNDEYIVGNGSGYDGFCSANIPSTDKLVIIYNNGGDVLASLATIFSGTIITYGTPITVTTNNFVDFRCCYDSASGKIVVFFQGGWVSLLTVVGNTVTANILTQDLSSSAEDVGIIAYDKTGQIIVQYGETLSIVVGSVNDSGDFVNWGTVQNFGGLDSFLRHNMTVDTTADIIYCAYAYQSGGSYQTYIFAMTIDGTVVTKGATTNIGNNGMAYIIYDPISTKTIVFTGKNPYEKYSVISADPDTLAMSYETLATIRTGTQQGCYELVYNPIAEELIYFLREESDDVYATTFTISGTTAVFGSRVLVASGVELLGYNDWQAGAIYEDSSNNIFFPFSLGGGTQDLMSLIYTIAGDISNARNTVGIANEAIADAETGIITLSGINDKQSGLTIGTVYYVNYIGTITGAPDTTKDYKMLGPAVSATEIFIGGIGLDGLKINKIKITKEVDLDQTDKDTKTNNGKNTNVDTNLDYTASPTNGVVTCSDGTDATLTLADGTDAGLMAPDDFTKLSSVKVKVYSTKTAAYTAVANDFIFANTNTTGAFTITLPITPSIGDTVIIHDSVGNFGTDNLTVGRNSETIMTAAADLVLDIDNSTTKLIYSGSDWRIIVPYL